MRSQEEPNESIKIKVFSDKLWIDNHSDILIINDVW